MNKIKKRTKKRSHEKLMKIALARPGVRKAYNELEEEFALYVKDEDKEEIERRIW